ncbi:MAG TPA: DUF3395 domain-containing protein, partial [Desulfuromonadaceae bacterium]|nr:DUF3395 domain-containing protein [Desulfuromonadaceae bacterium]
SIFISTIKWDLHQIQVARGNASPGSKNTDEKPGNPAARILKFHRDLAERGDPYGEYQMGLRYLNGDDVPKDPEKARDLLQRAVDQGESDAIAALGQAKMTIAENGENAAHGVVIQSAKFGVGNRMVDVTTNLAALLRDQPDGFLVNADMFRVDPAPGKKKTLTVQYSYKGTNGILTVQGGRSIAVGMLIRNAAK